MKNIYKLLKLSICGIIAFTLFYSDVFALTDDLTDEQRANREDEQKAIQEVAQAYYRKSYKINYDGNRRTFMKSPEDITAQKFDYFVCSSFTFNVYYEAFGLVYPDDTEKLGSYARQYKNNKNNNDIIKFYYNSENKNGLSFTGITESSEAAAKLKNEFLSNLEIGDLISYSYRSGAGHVVLVYDLIDTDNNGEIDDALILNATGNFDDNPKLKTSFSNILNSDTGIYEGTVKMTTLNNVTKTAVKAMQVALFRPLINHNGTYNRISCNKPKSDEINNDLDKNYILGYKCSMVDNEKARQYTIKDSTRSRLDYPGIEIEKTVDVHNGSVVEKGDILTYTLTIKNKGNEDYDPLTVVENLSPYVILDKDNPDNPVETGDINNTERTITWNIAKLKHDRMYTLKYAVKVNTNENVQIVSTGTVGNIPSSTVTNTVGVNININSDRLMGSYNIIVKENNYQGSKLINEIYKDTFNIDLGIDETNLGVMVNYGTISDEMINSGCYPYYDSNYNPNKNIIKFTQYMNSDHSHLSVEPDSANALSNAILNNYYNVLYVSYKVNENNYECNYGFKKFETFDFNGTDENNYMPTSKEESLPIQKFIYKDNLKNGDILLYSDSDNNKEVKQYAFIYINGKFWGMNDGLNEFNISDVINNELQTLLIKDIYVILRPFLMLDKIEGKADSNIRVDAGKRIIRNIKSTNNEIKYNDLINQIDTKSMFNFTEKDDNQIVKTGDDFMIYKLSVAGDVTSSNGNSDGLADIYDAKEIAKHIIDKNVITGEEYLAAADYNGNDAIKMNDVMELLKSLEN